MIFLQLITIRKKKSILVYWNIDPIDCIYVYDKIASATQTIESTQHVANRMMFWMKIKKKQKKKNSQTLSHHKQNKYFNVVFRFIQFWDCLIWNAFALVTPSMTNDIFLAWLICRYNERNGTKAKKKNQK